MSCHKIYRVEAVRLSLSNYSFKNYTFDSEYVKFGTISLKFDILSVTA